MESYELNRLKITGKLNDDTPFCVILEIANCVGCKLDESKFNKEKYIKDIITTCENISYETIHEDRFLPDNIHGFSDRNLQLIAKFINGDSGIKWKLKSLINSFRHLVNFYENKIPILPSNEFTIGQKTSIDHYAYNATMLYRLCVFYGITTSRNTTIYQMGQAIKYFIEDPDVLKKHLIETVNQFSRIEAVNLMMSNDLKIIQSPNVRNLVSKTKIRNNKEEKKIEKINIIYEDISDKNIDKALKKLNDHNYLLSKITPESHEEAIILSALRYAINLTECKNPYKEYLEMKNTSLNGSTENRYIPISDVKFKNRYLTNPSWFDMRLNWSSKLNGIYTKEQIETFAISEGYINEIKEGMSPLEIMNLSRCMPTFYLGEHPDLENSKTLIEFDSSKEINPKLLISYGIVEHKKFSLYKISELTSCFSDTKSFSNPENRNEQFSKNSILKLKNIALSLLEIKKEENTFFPFVENSKDEKIITTEIEFMYSNLLSVMEEIEIWNKNNSDQAKELHNFYKNGSNSVKISIENILNSLLETAYYMRGWKVLTKGDSLPIEENNCFLEIEDSRSEISQDHILINKNSSDSLENFIKCFENLDEEIKKLFEKLPLMRYQKSGNNDIFEASTNENEGLTIMERIKIINEGDSDDVSIYSCIRMSSSRLLSSGYYYSQICNLKLPFEIKKMAEIS